MYRISAQPRVSNFRQGSKRKQDDEYGREDKRHAGDSDSSATDSQAVMVEWNLTFGQPVALSITRNGYKYGVGPSGMQIGTERETVQFDGVTATFVGTETTDLQICFTMPTGHMDVEWYGNRICIDGTYSICEEGFHMANRPRPRTHPLRTISAIVNGEGSEPMTVALARRSYVIRFESGFPAIVVPRCSYYPLKLAMMKDFLEKFVPKELFTRSPKTADRLAEDSRLLSPVPHTPTTAEETDETGDRLTPPSKYIRYERSRLLERHFEDEYSDN